MCSSDLKSKIAELPRDKQDIPLRSVLLGADSEERFNQRYPTTLDLCKGILVNQVMVTQIPDDRYTPEIYSAFMDKFIKDSCIGELHEDDKCLILYPRTMHARWAIINAFRFRTQPVPPSNLSINRTSILIIKSSTTNSEVYVFNMNSYGYVTRNDMHLLGSESHYHPSNVAGDIAHLLLQHIAMWDFLKEIGRASCRERV